MVGNRIRTMPNIESMAMVIREKLRNALFDRYYARTGRYHTVPLAD